MSDDVAERRLVSVAAHIVIAIAIAVVIVLVPGVGGTGPFCRA